MKPRIAIVGAGMGGLTAAIRLATNGAHVTLFESRSDAGGLAGAFESEGYSFDAGPYILLDRPGLQWIYGHLGLNLSDLNLQKVDPVCEVNFNDGSKVRFHHSLEQTAREFEEHWSGAGANYRRYVETMTGLHRSLRPHLYVSRPGIGDAIRNGSWKAIPFLFRSLDSVLSDFQLPKQIRAAISIWTHVAGQDVSTAPSSMAFVPALIHGEGAFYPRDGIRSIPAHLSQVALGAGVRIRFNHPVTKLKTANGKVIGIVDAQQHFEPFDAVLSNAGGLNTYLNLIDETPRPVRNRLQKLPRQSPGVCIYMIVKKRGDDSYLRFLLPPSEKTCRLFVQGRSGSGGFVPARLIAPVKYSDAHDKSAEEMRDHADRLLEESWWKSGMEETRVLAVRTPSQWGSDFSLYENSMNPVMTGSSFRFGRMHHRSPWFERLYLAGSSTHPGQWVSFCGISGILAADLAMQDLGHASNNH